jgi:hypothetical protein
MKKITKLNEEQIERLTTKRDEWLKIGLSTERADRKQAQQGAVEAYQAAGLQPPKVFIWLDSPKQGAVGAALLSGTNFSGAQVRAQVRDQVWAQVYRAGYGSQDASWLSFYDYFAAEILDCAKLSGLNKIAKSCGWWWPFENAVIFTERPIKIQFDDEKLLYCEDGPAIAYSDGFEIYSWHGQRIPDEWIKNPKSLTPKVALTWDQIDQRTAACEILGWHNIINELSPVVLDEDKDPLIGRLIEVELPDHGKQKFIHAKCGTGREVAVMADRDATTILEAQASSYGLSVEDFSIPEIRT